MGKRDNIMAAISRQANTAGEAGNALMTMLGSDPLQQALLGSLDMGSVTERWDKTFAQPAMDAWWKYNAPGIRDEFAGIPGGFFSADRARGVTRAANQFMGSSVTPQLFGALEGAANRMPSMISAFTNPYASMAGAPIQMPQEDDSKGPLLGGLMGMGLAGLTGGMSQMFSPESMMMGKFGSMAGGLF